jgi:hypothetical protein
MAKPVIAFGSVTLLGYWMAPFVLSFVQALGFVALVLGATAY